MGQLMKSDPFDLMGTKGQEDLAKHMAGAQAGPQALKARVKASGQGGISNMLQSGTGLGTPIYSFQRGGTVPGWPGQPQAAIVHGGETVVPNQPMGVYPGGYPGWRPGMPVQPQGLNRYTGTTLMGAPPRAGLGRAFPFPRQLSIQDRMRRGGFVPPSHPSQQPIMPAPEIQPRPLQPRPGRSIRGPGGFQRYLGGAMPRRGSVFRPTPGGTRPGFGANRPMRPGGMQRPGFQRRGLGQGMQPRPNAWQRPTLQNRSSKPMWG